MPAACGSPDGWGKPPVPASGTAALTSFGLGWRARQESGPRTVGRAYARAAMDGGHLSEPASACDLSRTRRRGLGRRGARSYALCGGDKPHTARAAAQSQPSLAYPLRISPAPRRGRVCRASFGKKPHLLLGAAGRDLDRAARTIGTNQRLLLHERRLDSDSSPTRGSRRDNSRSPHRAVRGASPPSPPASSAP